jgi:hypothetical protein
VVTDPKLADAIFTDHLGEGFQAKLEDFSPTPKPPEPPKPAVAEPAAKTGDEPAPPAKPAHSDSKAKPAGDAPSSPDLLGKTENTLTSPTSSGFSRARGTVFLVDAKSRQVVWSIYEPPKDFEGKEMNRTASDIVSRLKKDLNPKK